MKLTLPTMNIGGQVSAPKQKYEMSDDELFQRAQAMFPGVDTGVISERVEKLKQQLPAASNAELVTIAEEIKNTGGSPALNQQMVRENVKQKYNIGPYSNENRQQLLDQEQENSGGSWRAALAGLGATIGGRDVAAAMKPIQDREERDRNFNVEQFDKQRANVRDDFEFDQKLEESEAAKALKEREKDPTSSESILAQQLAKRALPEMKFEGMPADKILKSMPFLIRFYEADQRKLAEQAKAEESRSLKEMVIGNSAEQAKANRELKAAELQSRRMTEGERLALQKQALDDRRYFEKERLGLDKDKLSAQRSSVSKKPTAGQVALDKIFAKDYDAWTSGGADTALSEIKKLEAVAEDLKSGRVGTGALSGLLPDSLTTNSLLKARGDVSSTIFKSLKAVMGSQFTEKDAERFLKSTWNEQDSEKNNIDRILRLARDLKSQARDKDAKAKYFEENGTLAGYRASGGGASGSFSRPNQQGGKKVMTPKDQKALDWATKNPNDPRAVAIRKKLGK